MAIRLAILTKFQVGLTKQLLLMFQDMFQQTGNLYQNRSTLLQLHLVQMILKIKTT